MSTVVGNGNRTTTTTTTNFIYVPSSTGEDMNYEMGEKKKKEESFWKEKTF